MDEKIDVFSFGNNVYALLTGLWPFYENEDDGYVQKELIAGNTGFIDDRYKTRSYGEGKMVELILMCWQYKAEDRPDIFEIVKFLRRVFDEAKYRDKLEREKKASNYWLPLSLMDVGVPQMKRRWGFFLDFYFIRWTSDATQ